MRRFVWLKLEFPEGNGITGVTVNLWAYNSWRINHDGFQFPLQKCHFGILDRKSVYIAREPKAFIIYKFVFVLWVQCKFDNSTKPKSDLGVISISACFICESYLMPSYCVLDKQISFRILCFTVSWKRVFSKLSLELFKENTMLQKICLT